MSRNGRSMTKLCVLVATALVLCLVLGAAPVGAVSGPRYVDQNVARDCAGKVPCYLSIQLAVNAAQAGDTIYVFPGTYEEGVNLSTMGAEGDITLITVDGNGNPTPGTVTVDNPGNDSEIYTGDPPFNGDVTIDGFVLRSAYGAIEVWVDAATSLETRDVQIRNVDASHTGGDGITVGADGNVTIENCTTNDNKGYGIGVRTLGDVTITGCTSNNNACPPASAGGIPQCEAHGIAVRDALGDVIITDSTANGNGDDGIELWYLEEVDSILVNGNIICGNASDGLELNIKPVRAEEPTVAAMGADATGNWWGCTGGPDAAECDTVNEINGSVDYTPWISKISASAAVDPANVGEPTVVSFQFSGGPPAVYLGQGPGDLRGPAPFTVTTNNGTLNGNGATVQEFINAPDGTLQVTLVPDTAGTATVTVSGPCGLGDLDGATAVLGVSAEFVPELGSVMLLGGGLMGLAGYAALRLRSGQGLRLRKR